MAYMSSSVNFVVDNNNDKNKKYYLNYINFKWGSIQS